MLLPAHVPFFLDVLPRLPWRHFFVWFRWENAPYVVPLRQDQHRAERMIARYDAIALMLQTLHRWPYKIG